MARPIRTLTDAFVGTPRPSQRAALPEIEEALRAADVVVVDAPVAAGKSKLAEAIARWVTSVGCPFQGAAGVGVPSNALLDQYERGLGGGWTFLRRRDLYRCHESDRSGGEEIGCEARKARTGGFCKAPGGNRWDPGACPWVRDLAAARGKRARVATTWHGWMAHSLGPRVAILDEAHGLVDFLAELGARRLWRSRWNWPRSVREIGDVERWIDSLPVAEVDGDSLLSALRDALDGTTPSVQVAWGDADHFGRRTEFISLRPLDGAGAPPVLWPPGKTEKIVLMSATLSRIDLQAMGLTDRRICRVRMASEIPPDRRPLVHLPRWDSRFANRKIPSLLDGIAEVLDAHPGQRGVIHATYALASEIRALTSRYPRLMFHSGPFDKGTAIERFLDPSTPEDSVLVISGQYEGLDLEGDRARFQILTSAPRPSLSDAATRWLLENRPEQYEWLTVRDLAQAYGRVCRGPDDFGVTVCLDASAARELASPLAPSWLREAIVR